MFASQTPSFFTKVSYGFGAVAYGVKNNGFDYFLLIFYSQVLGVDPALVGQALLIALLFDAVSDPVIGYVSDNTRTRWGRRHPWMYASAFPIALAYFFLWSPPLGATENQLFLYLVVLSILIRTLITFYEVPSSALSSEITQDYDQRTSLISYRMFFGWFGGTLIATFALAILFAPTDTYANGLMNRDAYATYGFVGSAVILVSILVASLGTHKLIPHLVKAPLQSKLSLGRIFRDIFETLANRSFVMLFLAAIFGAVSTGLSMGLSIYINGFFWNFSSDQMALIAFSVVFSSFISLGLAPAISRRLGKKRGAIFVGIVAFTIAPAPVALRLFGLMPENGDPLLFPIMLAVTVIDLALIISVSTLMQSMIADLVEDSQIRTKRRSEGVLFAAITFTRKAVQGFGVLAASLVLSFAEFPQGLAPGDVPEEALYRLGAMYSPSLFILWMIMIICLLFYKIDRATHQQNLETLSTEQQPKTSNNKSRTSSHVQA